MEMRLRLRVSAGVWSATAAFTDGADVRRDRVRLIAEETSSTVGVGAGFTALMRLDVSERVTLDLIVVYGGAYELARRRSFSFSMAAFWF